MKGILDLGEEKEKVVEEKSTKDKWIREKINKKK